jgi:putative FmdB family regulatory protein
MKAGMAIYLYRCASCDYKFSISRHIPNCDDPLDCPSCKNPLKPSNRVITPKVFFGEKPQEPFFSVALGKWVKGTKELRQIAKEKGWEEVGNEDPEKLLKESDKFREKRDNDRWAEFSAPIEVTS